MTTPKQTALLLDCRTRYRVLSRAADPPFEWCNESIFNVEEDAHAYVTATSLRTGYEGWIFQLLELPIFDVLTAWQDREQSRFDCDTYLQVPWANEPWAGRYARLHYPHLSLTQPGMISYTQSPEHGERDRQTIIKPGKYLLRYYPTWLHQTNVDALCAAINTKPFAELKFATTADAIVEVYRNGPGSCMDGHHERGGSFRTRGIHPCSVYGAGDLAVAYLSDSDHITARTICWPDKMIYGRLYGDVHRLKNRLQAAGYKDAYSNGNSNDFHGARLTLRRSANGDIICPYIDIGDQTVQVGRKHLIIGDGISADSTNGTIEEGNDDDDDTICCESCNTRIATEDSFSWHNESYCESCYGDRTAGCEHCGETVDNNDTATVHARYDQEWCSNCRSNDAYDCYNCGELFSNSMTEISGESICDSCLEDNYIKRPCGHYVDKDDHDDCDTCGAPEIVKIVKTTIRTHRVGVSA